jgi:hypothetical protein
MVKEGQISHHISELISSQMHLLHQYIRIEPSAQFEVMPTKA